MAITKTFAGTVIRLPGDWGGRRVLRHGDRPKDRHDFLFRMEDRGNGNEEAILNFLSVLNVEKFGLISHYIYREKRDSGDLYMCIYVWKTKK